MRKYALGAMNASTTDWTLAEAVARAGIEGGATFDKNPALFPCKSSRSRWRCRLAAA